MARPDDASAYADLLARLGDNGTKELFRRLLEQALQELIYAKLTAHSGVGSRTVNYSRGTERCWRLHALGK